LEWNVLWIKMSVLWPQSGSSLVLAPPQRRHRALLILSCPLRADAEGSGRPDESQIPPVLRHRKGARVTDHPVGFSPFPSGCSLRCWILRESLCLRLTGQSHIPDCSHQKSRPRGLWCLVRALCSPPGQWSCSQGTGLRVEYWSQGGVLVSGWSTGLRVGYWSQGGVLVLTWLSSKPDSFVGEGYRRVLPEVLGTYLNLYGGQKIT